MWGKRSVFQKSPHGRDQCHWVKQTSLSMFLSKPTTVQMGYDYYISGNHPRQDSSAASGSFSFYTVLAPRAVVGQVAVVPSDGSKEANRTPPNSPSRMFSSRLQSCSMSWCAQLDKTCTDIPKKH